MNPPSVLMGSDKKSREDASRINHILTYLYDKTRLDKAGVLYVGHKEFYSLAANAHVAGFDYLGMTLHGYRVVRVFQDSYLRYA